MEKWEQDRNNRSKLQSLRLAENQKGQTSLKYVKDTEDTKDLERRTQHSHFNDDSGKQKAANVLFAAADKTNETIPCCCSNVL